MAKPFEELLKQMPPEARRRARKRADAILARLRRNGHAVNNSSIRRINPRSSSLAGRGGR